MTDLESRAERDKVRSNARRVLQTPGEVNWQDTGSSAVKRIAYSKANSMFFAQFPEGGIYVYFDVPEEKLNALLAADSAGKFVNQEIKPYHSHVKIEYALAKHAVAAKIRTLLDAVVINDPDLLFHLGGNVRVHQVDKLTIQVVFGRRCIQVRVSELI